MNNNDQRYDGFWQQTHFAAENARQDAHKFSMAIHNGDPLKMFKTGLSSTIDGLGVAAGALGDLTIGPLYDWIHKDDQ